MLKTPICDLVGIQYPVFQGGMAWIADGKLAAAVSNGGGLGIIAASNAPGDYVREQIHLAKSLTDKPFGVNIMLLSPFIDEVAQIVAEEKVAVVTTGAGNPAKFIKGWLEAGIKVIPVVASCSMAKLMERLGNPARFGFPVFVVLDSEGNVLHIQDSSFLEEGKGYSEKKVLRFFKNWTPKAVENNQ